MTHPEWVIGSKATPEMPSAKCCLSLWPFPFDRCAPTNSHFAKTSYPISPAKSQYWKFNFTTWTFDTMSSFFFGSSKKESSTVSEKPAGTTKSTFSTKSTKSSKSVSSLAETDVAPNPTTTKIQTEPAPGTKIGPIHEYDEKQTEMMKQVKEVRVCYPKDRINLIYIHSVRSFNISSPIWPVCQMGKEMVEQAGHHSAIFASFKVES